MVDILYNNGSPVPDPNKKDKFLSYHIDKSLKHKWDKIKSGLLQKKDEDRTYIVDGRERTGKSVFTLQQAKYIDPTFNLDRVCFTPEEFLKQIRTAPQGSCIVFDEAFRGLSSKSSQSKVNKMIVQAMMEMGQRNLITFIVLPTIFLLEIYAAVLRSNALFHIYKDRNGIRHFKTYNYSKKSQLWNIGRKKGFSYRFPKVNVKNFGGRFFNIYSINEEAYRKKKMDSLGKEKVIKEDQEHYVYGQRDRLVAKTYQLFKDSIPKWNKARHSRWLEEINAELSRTMVFEILEKYGKELENRGKVLLSVK